MHSIKQCVLKTITRQWILTLLILILCICVIVSALLPPYILGLIVDTLSSSTQLSFSIIVLYFLSLVANKVSISARDSVLVIFGQKISHALRSAMMEHYTNTSAQLLSKQESGEVVSRFISDVDQIEQLFSAGIISLFADTLQMLSILYIIFQKTKGLFILLLIILPCVFLYTRYVQKHMLKAESQNRQAIAEANACIPETIHNILTIHNLNKEAYMENKYTTVINKSYTAISKTNFYDAIYSPTIQIIDAITIAIVMALSASHDPMILSFFGMRAGTAVTIFNYTVQIFAPIENIGMEIQTIQSAIACINRINAFLQTPQETKTISTKTAQTNHIISVNHISFAYNKEDILHDTTLTIDKGEHVTLVGRTGAGKTTLFKLILGLYTPQTGSILVCGQDPFTIPPQQRRSIFGYVEQKFHPVIGTIRDQITLYDTSISDEQVTQALALTGLLQTIQSFPNKLDTPCSKELFSQGQWQSLSIARAIVCDPPILMFDEITADLDAEYEKHILETLQQISKNKTILSISHRQNEKSTRIIRVDENRISKEKGA